jgi:putative endonuclease
MRKQSKGPHIVYIVRCSDDSLYTGITIDIKNRLRQHNGEIVGGAFYTKNKRPVKLVYTEEYKTHKEAAIREVKIKQLTRKQKEKLLSKD